jgi:hypothetical protein
LIVLLYAYPKNMVANLTPKQVSQLARIVKEEVRQMKKEMFEELLGSVREAGAILRGQKKPPRRMAIGSSGVRAIRERTSLS